MWLNLSWLKVDALKAVLNLYCKTHAVKLVTVENKIMLSMKEQTNVLLLYTILANFADVSFPGSRIMLHTVYFKTN